MNAPDLKSSVIVEGSADGVTFSAITALAFAQVDFLYSAADHPIVFTTRYTDLSTYTDIRITYDGRVYVIDQFMPVIRTWAIFISLTPSTLFSPILDFEDGFNQVGNTITANINTGVAGGQTIYGDTAANGDLTIEGTSHPTKTTSYVLLQAGGGNVGIGVSAPTQKLQVGGDVYSEGPGTGTSNVLLRSVGAAANIQFNRPGYNNWYIGSPDNSVDLGFSEGTIGAYCLYMKSGGNVGVGTTAPPAKLSVAASAGYGQFNMATTYTPTSSADANGSNGNVAYDANYIYIKVGGSWKRAALSTF